MISLLLEAVYDLLFLDLRQVPAGGYEGHQFGFFAIGNVTLEHSPFQIAMRERNRLPGVHE